MKTAEELYTDVVVRGVDNINPDELRATCAEILKASGNVAAAICTIANEGWWDYSVAEPSRAILDADGSRVFAYMWRGDWWDETTIKPNTSIIDPTIDEALIVFWAVQNNKVMWKEPCRAILKSTGNAELIINLAKRLGWWSEYK